MERLKQHIWACMSMLLGAFLPYIYSLAEKGQAFVYIISILCLFGGLICIALLQYQQKLRTVKYTNLIFVLDADNRLLTVYNTYHKRLMIPCGVLPPALTPNKAVEVFLEKQVGLKQGEYAMPTYLQNKSIDTESFYPTNAQLEFVTKHENKTKLHYSYIYFLQITKPVEELTINANFMDLDTLQSMNPQEGLFSDILTRYKNYINLQQQTERIICP